jgi:RNA polymerase sigma factor (sigma-70 family)
MSAFTLTEMDRLLALDDAERTFQMDEETFRLFYQQTARPLWSYLARIAGDRRHADDLLQETYYRFLRASATFESDEHRQRYLFRIATNLSRDFRRRADTRAVTVSVEDSDGVLDQPHGGDASPESRLDVGRALTRSEEDPGQAIRLRKRQRAQQHGVDDAEHGRAGANTKRQRQNRHGRKRRSLDELAERVSGI